MKTFRDRLAILVAVIIIPLLWVGQGLGSLQLPGEVVGATIAIETLIANFYFRKKPKDEPA